MRNVHVIIDGSGSLSVKGKRSALIYVVGALLRQVRWQGGRPLLYVWGEAVARADEGGWMNEAPHGAAETDALAAFLAALPEEDGALVVTDGLWEDDDALAAAAKACAAELAFVALGPDADRLGLARLAPAYRAEDACAAVAALLEETKEMEELPETLPDETARM